MCLTGDREEEPEICPVPLPGCADAALNAYRALTGSAVLPGLDGGILLTERAAITGFHRNGALSLQGHCRLLATRDGWIGINLAREDDWESLPALLKKEGEFDWATLAEEIRDRSTAELVTQGELLGLAVVDATDSPDALTPWFGVVYQKAIENPAINPFPKVVDLSSLWAGPLCSHLWQLSGARVTKVESSQRPDGGRIGSPGFFELLNQGKHVVRLELHTPNGRAQLRRLIMQADIVLEASRPRALQQMGIRAEEIIDQHPGLTWISITGYGRSGPRATRVAYGDDAGIAAGLSAILNQVSGQWLICGDAIADPLTGLHAALAGWASWLTGGGKLIDISLEQVIRHCISATAPADNTYRQRYDDWRRHLQENHIAPHPPRCRDEVLSSAR